MSIIENNEIINAIRICSNPDRYSMLKVLEKLDEVKFTTLRQIIIHVDSKDPRFNYHLRTLSRAKLVKNDPISGLYKLTQKGRDILEILSRYSEKFMTDDEDKICNNSQDNSHEWVLVCRRCAHVKEPVGILA